MKSALIAVTVVRVLSAERITVTDHGRDMIVRVPGIECPSEETFLTDPAGVAAVAAARQLLRPGARIVLAAGARAFAQTWNGETYAYVQLADGRDYGLVMIQRGRCDALGWSFPHPRGAVYRDAAVRRGQRLPLGPGDFGLP